MLRILTLAAASSVAAAASIGDGLQLALTQISGNNAGFQFNGQLFPKLDAFGSVVDFDAHVSYEFGGNTFGVTLLDRRAYATAGNVGAVCLSVDQVPPVYELVDAFLHPTAGESSDLKCPEGKSPIVFTFSGDKYGLCATSGALPTAGDADAIFKFLKANSDAMPTHNALIPAVATLTLSTCPVVYDDSAVRIRDRRSRQLEAQANCECKGGKKACLFVHGMGLKADGPALDDYPKCWGDIKAKAQCCSSIKFMQMDTVNNAWYGDYLAKKVCDTAIGMAKSGSDKMALQDIALIGHSMGNLVIANAEMKGYCALGAGSKWISLAGPLYGSKSANLALTACNSGNGVIVGPLSFFGFCPVSATIASLPYKNSNSSTATIDALYEQANVVYHKRVTSNLCGVSASGLTSTRSIQYGLLGSISGHVTSENDGAVHILSCQAGLDASKYSTSWNGGNFYKADINHGDASFVTGDGMWGDSRKPIKWFNCQF